MDCLNCLPNYFSKDDILVTQQKVECKVNNKLFHMGFLDSGTETNHLNPGKTVNVPLWYINDLKNNNSHFTVEKPNVYKNVHESVCEAETTHIELGKLHPFFYEYGRYLTQFDNETVGKIVFETLRQRVRYLLDISKNVNEDAARPMLKLDNIENKLYEMGLRTNTSFKNWLQMKSRNIAASEMVYEHFKKRKRVMDDEISSLQSLSKR